MIWFTEGDPCVIIEEDQPGVVVAVDEVDSFEGPSYLVETPDELVWVGARALARP